MGAALNQAATPADRSGDAGEAVEVLREDSGGISVHGERAVIIDDAARATESGDGVVLGIHVQRRTAGYKDARSRREGVSSPHLQGTGADYRVARIGVGAAEDLAARAGFRQGHRAASVLNDA